MEINPTRLVKGQGPAKIIAKRNKKLLNMDNEDSPKMVVAVLEEL